MVTETVEQTIQTSIGSIPNPSNWAKGNAETIETFVNTDEGGSVSFLEKATDGRVTVEDIKDALNEYKRLYKAGIASPAEILTLSRAYPDNKVYSNALSKMDVSDDDQLVVGGPASIELVDREGHLITTGALDKAFQKYMANFRTRNAMVLHSDVQVGWALPAYISKGGQIFKSGVDGKGLFFITELRNDTKIAKKVAEQIHNGKLKSYSIAGSALKTQTIQKDFQDVMQVDELELAEVTVCEKGVNQAASFDIIKAEGATSTCIDGSCLISKEDSCDCGCDAPQGVEFMYKSDGDIDFTKSFMNFIKSDTELQKIVQVDDAPYGAAFPTLNNTQARQDEHHRLLTELGFPDELEAEYARYTPVLEDDPTTHRKVPWSVNEAGENLGTRHYDEALTKPQIGRYTKRGVVEGGNSTETPVSALNTTDSFTNILSNVAKEAAKEAGHPWYSPEIGFPSTSEPIKLSKSHNFFQWMDNTHLYKEGCRCESCFQKEANYRGVVEKATDFLA
tara:strand:+ start:1809 stop:3329 length:1521 start_codon:yes stop_codon:yes gene_type:complete